MKNENRVLELKKIRSRIDWMCTHKVNAFSPTISPAPKSMERLEIESIYEGIRYYVQKGVHDLVVQRKYMGSYCDIYLHKDNANTYFVSRNGYKIDHINLEEAKAACVELHNRFDWTDLEIVLIQAELLPWSVLGKRLIDREFGGYLDAHSHRLNYLQSSGMLEKISKVKSGVAYTAFQSDRDTLSGAAFKKKYSAHIIRQYDALGQIDMPDMAQYADGVAIFGKQKAHFAKEGAVYFKPFNVFKKIYTNGWEEIPDDNSTYLQVNDDEMKILHFETEEDIAGNMGELYEWFASLTSELEEGIVIKPLKAFIKGLPPALKVRNNDYLTMIYGVDFQMDFLRQMRRRSIRSKLTCSINDWAINHKLLGVPYQDIREDNYYYKNLMLDRILEEESESRLDPAL